jgi:hypothetical protein
MTEWYIRSQLAIYNSQLAITPEWASWNCLPLKTWSPC